MLPWLNILLLALVPVVALTLVVRWLGRTYRLPPYAGWGERLWHFGFLAFCCAVLLFLIAPILVVIPLSFNAESFFSFTSGMLRLDPEAYSLTWYKDILLNGVSAPEGTWPTWSDIWNNAQWVNSMKNSFIVGIAATFIATSLGTLAALGLSRPEMPYRNTIMSLLISPMIVPIAITALASFFFLARAGIVYTYWGLILMHAVIGIPFVIITVTATLTSFDNGLIRAAQSLGAPPWTTFRKVILPLILPGMVSGALFAFVTSFDEVVLVYFIAGTEQRTIPRQMWAGIREQISPTILAVATILVVISVLMLSTIELLRRRSERLRGVTPA
ncbi:MAG: ABC transporter permease [Hyphomicrobiaceae bacterium]|nr:MAG: ABC transporter permease [Hyphomicrobiaceae bacterium]